MDVPRTGIESFIRRDIRLVAGTRSPRPNIDSVYDNIIEEFHAGEYGDHEPQKSKLKNLGILHEILDKIDFVYECDDESSLAKGRHFF